MKTENILTYENKSCMEALRFLTLRYKTLEDRSAEKSVITTNVISNVCSLSKYERGEKLWDG